MLRTQYKKENIVLALFAISWFSAIAIGINSSAPISEIPNSALVLFLIGFACMFYLGQRSMKDMPEDHTSSAKGNAIYKQLLESPARIKDVALVESLSGKVYLEVNTGEQKNQRIASGLIAVKWWVSLKSVGKIKSSLNS